MWRCNCYGQSNDAMIFISQENKDQLTLKCADLISKTLVELGQIKSDKDIAILSNSLCMNSHKSKY